MSHVHPGHQASAGRGALRRAAICLSEPDAVQCQFIEIWSPKLLLSVAAQIVV